MNIKKILVSQARPSTEKSPYFDIEKKYGVEIVFRPFILVEGVNSKDYKKQKISILDYTAVIFTAKVAIDNFFRLCEELRVNVPETMKYFCVSEAVAHYLQKYIQYRKRKIFHTETGKFEYLLPIVEKHKKEKFLLPTSNVNDMKLKAFANLDIQYSEAVMYRMVSNDFTPEESFDYDALIFFSPAGVESLMKNFPEFKQGEIAIGCMGNSTKKAIEDAGLRLDFMPDSNCPSITGALENFLKNK